MAKVPDKIEVSLFDPESGKTSNKFVTELKAKNPEKQLEFTSLTEPRETATQLVVVVRSTTQRFEDDIDYALARTKEVGFEVPNIVIYFHTTGGVKNCSETDNEAKLVKKYKRIKIIDMDFSGETLYGQLPLFLCLRDVNKKALSLLKKNITPSANVNLEKKLFVLDKTNSKQSEVIIGYLKEFMLNELEIEEVKEWREDEPVAVIFSQEDLRNNEFCLKEFSEGDTSNTMLFRLQTEQTSDTSVQDTAHDIFKQNLVDINIYAKNSCFINFGMGKKLTAFVRSCNVHQDEAKRRKEDGTAHPNSTMSKSNPQPDM